MIKDEIIVKRYAEAFWGYARETIGTEKCLRDLKGLRGIIRENPSALQFLRSLEITHAEKHDFIDKILNEDFSPETKWFIKLLLDKERIDNLPDIIEYLRVIYAHKGETGALLKISFPLDVDLIKTIKNKLEEKYRKRLKLYIQLDGSLLGGIQVVIGNTIVDNSIRKRLDELRADLRGLRIS